MNESNHPRIISSEWLPTGIMVHFDKRVSVFYSAEFLYEQRGHESNRIYRQDKKSLSSDHQSDEH
jgi:hypothetical protein